MEHYTMDTDFGTGTYLVADAASQHIDVYASLEAFKGRQPRINAVGFADRDVFDIYLKDAVSVPVVSVDPIPQEEVDAKESARVKWVASDFLSRSRDLDESWPDVDAARARAKEILSLGKPTIPVELQ